MNELIKQVELWSVNKGLDAADPSKQFLKVAEEVGEVASALARGEREALRDGIGDVVVTLIILAQQHDMTLHECLECAYDEIKDRTGEMVNGVFVKSSDLFKAIDLNGVPNFIELTNHYDGSNITLFDVQLKRIEKIEDERDLFQLPHGVITFDNGERLRVEENHEEIIRIIKESRIADKMRGRIK